MGFKTWNVTTIYYSKNREIYGEKDTMIYLCANGCGQIREKDMIQNKEGLEDGDKSLYCPHCKKDGWFLIPEDKTWMISIIYSKDS